MNQNIIPKTDSIQELATFWDSHDLTNFDDELIEITEPVFIKETVMEIRLSSNEAKTVKKIARSQGIGVAELIHSWVLEKTQIIQRSSM